MKEIIITNHEARVIAEALAWKQVEVCPNVDCDEPVCVYNRSTAAHLDQLIAKVKDAPYFIPRQYESSDSFVCVDCGKKGSKPTSWVTENGGPYCYGCYTKKV